MIAEQAVEHVAFERLDRLLQPPVIAARQGDLMPRHRRDGIGDLDGGVCRSSTRRAAGGSVRGITRWAAATATAVARYALPVASPLFRPCSHGPPYVPAARIVAGDRERRHAVAAPCRQALETCAGWSGTARAASRSGACARCAMSTAWARFAGIDHDELRVRRRRREGQTEDADRRVVDA